MGDFAVLVFKIAFLAALWLFIGLIAVTIRSDLVGHKAKPSKDAVSVRAARPPAAAEAAAPVGAAGRRSRAANRRAGKDFSPSVLAVDSGTLAGQRLQLVDHVQIGRSPDCALLLDDEYVTSKHPHARLDRQLDGSWLLTDLGSTNGTYVNGRKLTAPRLITPADTIQIGRTQLRLER
ncbi:MAG: FHA domain-containing protein [Propionibacteriaceae bacterium]|jgi:hypothetical protein|nr:FHA domain-containing protein [Propionibacteriaceae bacterium]